MLRSLTLSLLVLASPTAKEPTWRDIADTTYEERQKAIPVRQPAPIDSIAIPWPHAVKRTAPVLVARGEPVTRHGHPERLFWQLVPAKVDHTVYLEKRKTLLEKNDPMKLIVWCERENLRACAAFEARCAMRQYRDDREVYNRYYKKWLRYADRAQIPHSFPLPFDGEWHVVVDRSKHHRASAGSTYAFDLVIRKNDKYYRNYGKKLEDYYTFGEPILAQADGVVTAVVDDQPDLPPGEYHPGRKGNAIQIDYGGGIHAVYAHNKKGSARVKKGQRVQRGDVIAAVGNSGQAITPHLHFSFLDAGHLSMKGRFTFEVRRGKRWRLMKGQDLKEGTYVRNRPE